MLEYYDIKTKILTIPYRYNKTLKDIPLDTIKIIFYEPLSLWYVSLFDEEIQENVLPKSLTHLTFGFSYKKEIKENILPKSLTHLTFGFSYNKEIKKNVLPEGLTHLTFGALYSQEIKENVLPTSLTHLILGSYYNEKIILPPYLIHLTLGYYFNKSIILPQSLRELGFYKKCHIKDNIPDFVEKIIICCSRSGKITNIPSTIKEIIINNSLGIELIEKIPFWMYS
jgi:Leucine-rich repeat (LRR) protein